MKVLSIFFCLILVLFSVSLLADSKQLSTQEEKPHSIFLGTVIRDNDQTIPLFLRTVEKLDYDKKSMTLQINLFNNTESIKERFKEWIEANKGAFKEIIFVDNSAITKNKKYDESDLNQIIAGIKDEYLIKTKMRNCDYCMIIASDVFLKPATLKILMQKKKPIIVPLLLPAAEPESPFRNFFAAATAQGYYKEHKDYYPIANREKLGTFKVPCAHMAYLINADNIDKLSFSDHFEHWEFVSFSNNARQNNVDQYICNEKEFGFFLHSNMDLTSEEEKSIELANSEPEMTHEYLYAIISPHYARDPALKAYVDGLDLNSYALYRIQSKNLYYIDDDRDNEENDPSRKAITWKEHLHDRFEKYVQPGTVALDIGGFAGIDALILSRLVGNEGVVHVFEPQNKMFCELAINVHINQCKNVTLHRQAVGNNEANTALNNPSDKVQFIRLDQMNLNNVSFIKIDVEGNALEVIRGGLETIKRNRPVLLMKLNETAEKLERIKEIESLGYFSVYIDEEDYLFLPVHLLNMDAANHHQRDKLQKSKLSEKPISVVWEGSFIDCGSLSNVNRCLTGPLRKNSNIKLTCVGPNALTPKLAKIPELLEMSKHLHAVAPNDTKVTVRHAWPPNWQAPVKGKWVIIQPWEFGSLPEEWVAEIKNVTEVWAPSNYVKHEYVKSGVAAEKIYIVPNGIDPEKFDPDAKPYPLATKKKFKFLFLGGTIWRKGGDLLLDTYLRTFKPEDDVSLVIKDFGSKGCYAGQTHETQIKAAQANPANPEIVYLDQEMSVDDIAGLYTACDCLVYPYRGEGFALPVLEAMASGIPVIVTAGGPTDDFVTDECGWFIPSTVRTYGPTLGTMKLVDNSWLLEPDTDILSAQMRWIVTHQAEVSVKGAAASRHAKQNWSWQRAASIAAERLNVLGQ